MTRLFEIKALITGVYKKYDKVINPVGRFILALIILISLNRFFAYSELFSKLEVNVAMAAMAAFLPGSWFLLLLIFNVALQLFSASIEVSIIATLMMLVFYFLFARLQPKYAYFIILTPLFYSLKLIYVLPLFAGLFFGPGAIISLGVGIATVRFVTYLPGLMEQTVVGSSLFESPDIILNMYKYTMDAMLHDGALVLFIVMFTLAIVGMYYARRLEMDYIHYIVVGGGALSMMIIFIIGNLVLKAGLGTFGMILSMLVSTAIVCAAQFFKFSLDYKRSEKLQFEDDEYFYYVKTIPKIKAAPSQKEMKQIK